MGSRQAGHEKALAWAASAGEGASQGSFADAAARVVKAFNTMNATLMVEPGVLPERHTLLICGNDDAAKAHVRELATSFGWPGEDILDLGDISAARGAEMYFMLWLRLALATETWQVAMKVITP